MEEQVRIAVCDDEKNIRDYLSELIGRYAQKAQVDAFSSGEALLAAQVRYDIIFLDIKMEGMNGMETARMLRREQSSAEIVFVTGLEEYVFQAFDVEACQYLVKPVPKARLLQVLENALEKCRKKRQLSHNNAEREGNYILVKTGNISRKIGEDDIYYAEVFNRKVVLHTAREEIEYYARLSDLEKNLGSHFFRCHRACLVHLKYVEQYDSGRILLENGFEVMMARQKYAEFVKAYLQYQKSACRVKRVES